MRYAATGCPMFFSTEDASTALRGDVPLRSTGEPYSPTPNASSASGTAAWPSSPMGCITTVGTSNGSAAASSPRAAPTKMGFFSGVMMVRRMSRRPCRDVRMSRIVSEIGA